VRRIDPAFKAQAPPLVQATVIEHLRRAECPDGALVQCGLISADDGNDRIAPPELSAFVGSVWSARLPRYQSNPRTRANRIAAPSINAPTRADRVIPGQIAEHERDEADQHHRGVGLCASRDQHFASRSQQGQFPYLHPFRRLSPAEEENDAEKKTRPEH